MADQYHHGNLKSKLLEEAVTLISQDGLENLSLRRPGNTVRRESQRHLPPLLTAKSA